MEVRDVNVEHRRAHGVDQHDMEIAVVPADDAGAVFVAEVDLPLGDHCLDSLGLPLPSPPFLIGRKIIILRRRSEPSQPASMLRTAASISAPVSCQSLSRLATTRVMNGSDSRIALALSPR